MLLEFWFSCVKFRIDILDILIFWGLFQIKVQNAKGKFNETIFS